MKKTFIIKLVIIIALLSVMSIFVAPACASRGTNLCQHPYIIMASYWGFFILINNGMFVSQSYTVRFKSIVTLKLHIFKSNLAAVIIYLIFTGATSAIISLTLGIPLNFRGFMLYFLFMSLNLLIFVSFIIVMIFYIREMYIKIILCLFIGLTVLLCVTFNSLQMLNFPYYASLGNADGSTVFNCLLLCLSAFTAVGLMHLIPVSDYGKA